MGEGAPQPCARSTSASTTTAPCPAARKGAPILAIQSGAAIPDEPMVVALDRYFAVIPFSGVPLAGHEITTAKPPPADEAQA